MLCYSFCTAEQTKVQHGALGRNRYHHLWTNTLVLCFPVSSLPLIIRGISLNISILSINPTGPLFIICPCIIPVWAMSWLTCDTIINVIGSCFRQLRGVFKLILRGTAPGQLIKYEIVFYLLLQILTLGFFFEIAPSSLPLPPSSKHFSRGTLTSSDCKFSHSISSAAFSVPSALQASPLGFEASFQMSAGNSKCWVSVSLNLYDRMLAFLCSFSPFQPTHQHSLDNQDLGCVLTIVKFVAQ